ncbi:flavin reductase family protein [Glutamicibacter uratoxydans]|uniref:flavin reductase family protein n=1 Tax=Glutamicibacter uratoxydans TaxID=43667 RepID=UPI003D6ED61A
MDISHPSLDPQVFRQVMGTYPTGVVLVTAMNNNEPIAMVVGTFNSVSIDPPLIGFLPMRSSKRFALIDDAEHFAVNILGSDQIELCNAVSRNDDPFGRFSWTPDENGAPVFDGVIGSISCAKYQTVDAGDHFFCMGAVTALSSRRTAPPLVFFQGEFGSYGRLRQMSEAEVISAVQTIQPLQPGLRELSTRLNSEVSIISRTDQEMVTVTAIASNGKDNPSLLGQRLPLIAPLGELFVAADKELKTRWLQNAKPEVREMLEQRLAQVAETGWSVSMTSEYRTEEVSPALQNFQLNPYTPQRYRELSEIIGRAQDYYTPADLNSAGTHSVAGITVPIMGNGVIHCVLRTSGFASDLTGQQIQDIAAQMLEFAQSSSFLLNL